MASDASLGGFVRPQGRRDGGLASLWLVAVGDVEAVETGGSGDRIAALRLAGGAVPLRCPFREGTGRYSASATGSGALLAVRHEVSFSLARFDGASAAALGAGAAGGFVAVVRTSAGGTFLVGWSRSAGLAFPLRMRAASGDTGSLRSEESACRIVLRSSDTAFACPVDDGALPWEQAPRESIL